MDELDLEQVVEAVTQHVLKALRAEGTADLGSDGRARILILGDAAQVPEMLTRNAVCCSLDTYQKARNIQCYQKVVIERLTLAQMVDLAQGRPTDDVCCAVIQALLCGVDVVLLEKALPHRRYAGQGSTSFYQMLEGYTQTLQVFGMKLLGSDQLRQPVEKPVSPPKYQAPCVTAPKGSARPNESRLITEGVALSMLESAEGELHLPAGAIVTPSARDVFSKAQIKLIQDP